MQCPDCGRNETRPKWNDTGQIVVALQAAALWCESM